MLLHSTYMSVARSCTQVRLSTPNVLHISVAEDSPCQLLWAQNSVLWPVVVLNLCFSYSIFGYIACQSSSTSWTFSVASPWSTHQPVVGGYCQGYIGHISAQQEGIEEKWLGIQLHRMLPQQSHCTQAPDRNILPLSVAGGRVQLLCHFLKLTIWSPSACYSIPPPISSWSDLNMIRYDSPSVTYETDIMHAYKYIPWQAKKQRVFARSSNDSRNPLYTSQNDIFWYDMSWIPSFYI